MIAELEPITEGRAWAFRRRSPIRIVRLRWSKPAIASLYPQHSASRHQLLEFTDRRCDPQRITARNGIPEATLITVSSPGVDSVKLRTAPALGSPNPPQRTSQHTPSPPPRPRPK